jgi:hypothetical protein
MDATLILIDSDSELARARALLNDSGSRMSQPTLPGCKRKHV